jgi:mRNA interferase MazF
MRGDLVWLAFDPQAGYEQARRRPALSPRSYNQKSGLALACPITNQVKGYPFEVPLPLVSGVSRAILADHLKSLDWRARRVAKIGRIAPSTLDEVLARLAPLLGY